MLYGMCCADVQMQASSWCITVSDTCCFLYRQHIVRVQQDADPKHPGKQRMLLSCVQDRVAVQQHPTDVYHAVAANLCAVLY